MKKFIFIVGGVVLGIYLSSLVYIASHVFDDTAKKSDAILVLGARSVYKDMINPCLAERVKKGVDLQKKGLASKIIMSGGSDRFGENSQAKIMKELAIKHGVASNSVLLEESSKNTHENIVFSQKIMKENAISSVILVSDPYHLPRASLIAKTLKINHTVAPALYSPCWSTYTFLGIDFFRDGFALIAYILSGKISLW